MTALFLAAVALAADAETTVADAEAEPGELTVDATFSTEGFASNDLDFKPLDNTSDQAILDSDDAARFAVTGIALDLAWRPHPHASLLVAASHRGLWGSDQIGKVDPFGGFLYVQRLALELRTAADGGVVTTIGRMPFSIGGLQGAPDYVWSDTIDAVRIDIPLGDFGSVIAIPVDVVAGSTDIDGADFVSFVGQSTDPTYDFDGKTVTHRHALVVRLDGLPAKLDLTPYGAFTGVGAGGSGSDISYDGLLGNASDNDWVANAGLRASTEVGPVRPWLTFDASTGIDRQAATTQDIDCNGVAFGGGARLATGEDHHVAADLAFFDAIGGAFDTKGIAYSHGYVGMKGAHTGGVIFNRFLGLHPTAYVGVGGVQDNPQDRERKAGTRTLHASALWRWSKGPSVKASWWFLSDRAVSFVDPADVESLTPPFGIARESIAAQTRLGDSLGHEVDLQLGWRFEPVDVWLTGATVTGANFYETPIDRVAGDALGSAAGATPWLASLGLETRF